VVLAAPARVEWTDAVTDAFGRIKALLEKRGQRIEDVDAAIAAHAVASGATLVTANLRQMVRVPGLAVESWLTSG
jgi:tRNA(fMet)-specific endonuclease VapC